MGAAAGLQAVLLEVMGELQELRSRARAMARCCRPGSAAPAALLELRERLLVLEEVERRRVSEHRSALRKAHINGEAPQRASKPQVALRRVLTYPRTPATAERRVRVFERKAGWRFVYELRTAEGWERVQEREPGSSWSLEEASHRAEVYASMVGAFLSMPRIEEVQRETAGPQLG